MSEVRLMSEYEKIYDVLDGNDLFANVPVQAKNNNVCRIRKFIST